MSVETKKEPFLDDSITADYKGKPVRFVALPMRDTMGFLDLLQSSGEKIMEIAPERLNVFIAKSIGRKPEEIPDTDNFRMFAIKHVMEACDIPFLLKNSKELLKGLKKTTDEMSVIVQSMEELQPSSQALPGSTDTKPDTSLTP